MKNQTEVGTLCFHRFIVNRIKAILYLVSADVKITHEFSIRHALSVSGKLFELCAALVNEILGYHSLLPLSCPAKTSACHVFPKSPRLEANHLTCWLATEIPASLPPNPLDAIGFVQKRRKSSLKRGTGWVVRILVPQLRFPAAQDLEGLRICAHSYSMPLMHAPFMIDYSPPGSFPSGARPRESIANRWRCSRASSHHA